MKFPLIGLIRGCDARTKPGYSCRVWLRETSNFYVSENGVKYRKRNGSQVGAGSFPLYYLDVKTVHEFKPTENTQ